MEFVSFTFTEQRKFPHQFHAYLKLRYRIFVKGLGWPVWNDGQIEMDQYDNPFATYVLAIKQEKVIGGGRILPDGADWGGWTQMAKDTQLGKISTMSPRIVAMDFDFSGVWECSRFVIDHQDMRTSDRIRAFSGFIDKITSIAQTSAAKSMLSISPPPLQSTLIRRGYDVVQVGEVFTDTCDGRPYCALQMRGLSERNARKNAA